MSKAKITVAQAASIMGISVQALRVQLQLGKFDFGCAYKNIGSDVYQYVIFPEKFREYYGDYENLID